jgi:hypothetical protein
LLNRIKKINRVDIDEKHSMIWVLKPTEYIFVRQGIYTLCSTARIEQQLTRKHHTKETQDILIGYQIPKWKGLRWYEGIYYYVKSYDLDYISNVAVFRGFPYGAIRIV